MSFLCYVTIVGSHIPSLSYILCLPFIYNLLRSKGFQMAFLYLLDVHKMTIVTYSLQFMSTILCLPYRYRLLRWYLITFFVGRCVENDVQSFTWSHTASNLPVYHPILSQLSMLLAPLDPQTCFAFRLIVLLNPSPLKKSWDSSSIFHNISIALFLQINAYIQIEVRLE